MKLIIGLFLSLLFWTACVSPPEYPEEPIIEFQSVNKLELDEETDSLIIVISYTDGDGDLGREDTTADMFLGDNRVEGFFTPYQIPFIESLGNFNDISGTITITRIPNLINCFPDKVQDTVTYSVQIMDRAGNLSNIVTTPPLIIVNCD